MTSLSLHSKRHVLEGFLTAESRQLAILIGAVTLIRLIVIPSFGLGVDEAHYLLYGLNPALSYVDHPPLVGWVQMVALTLLGNSEAAGRIVAVGLMGVISWQAYRFLIAVYVSHRDALWSLVALNSAVMFGALGLMLLPENFLLLFLFPLMRAVLDVQTYGRSQDYFRMAFWLGLCGLAKYTAILLVPAILGYLIAQKRWDRLFNRHVLSVIVIGLVMISPVIVWNMQHQWISFTYQSDHVTGGTMLSFKPFIKSLSGQVGTYDPWFFLMAIYGWWYAWRSTTPLLRLSGWIGGVVALFFILTAFLKPVLPHWSALFYLLFIPIGCASLLAQGWQKMVKGLILLSSFLSLVIHAELVGKWGQFPDYQSPFRDIYGYEAIAKQGSRYLQAHHAPLQGLAVTNWTYGSRLMYYARPYGSRVFTLDEKNRQFALWEGVSPLGYDLIFVSSHFAHDVLKERYRCEGWQPLGQSDIKLNGGIVDTITWTLCHHYQGVR